MSKKPIEEQTASELVEYIRKDLRPELQQRREVAEGYESAFGKFKDQERKGLLHMIRQFGDDRKRGAVLFRELAETVLPPEPKPEPTEQEEPMSEETTEEKTEPKAEETAPQWALDLQAEIAELRSERTAAVEQDNAAAIEELKQTAKGFGLKEDTPEWTKFFSIAASDLANGDLEVAKGIYEKLEGPIGGESTEEAEEEAPVEEKAKFPKTSNAGGNGAPDTNAGNKPEIDFSNKRAVNEAAAAYIDNMVSGNAATP